MVHDDEVTTTENHVDIGSKDIKEVDGAGDHNHEHGFDHGEKQIAGEANPLPELQRKLKSRHLSMIAIGKTNPLTVSRHHVYKRYLT